MVYNKTIFCLLAILYSSFCIAEPRDPTQPFTYSKTEAEYGKTDNLKLSSIWVSNKSRRATINGVTAKQGDIIFSDIKIVKIFNSSVLIKQNGVTRSLTLLTRPYKTR